jgi:hypothetical protein
MKKTLANILMGLSSILTVLMLLLRTSTNVNWLENIWFVGTIGLCFVAALLIEQKE